MSNYEWFYYTGLGQFDSVFKREAISDYLLGIYDDNLNNKRIELKEVQKQLDNTIDKLNLTATIISKTKFARELKSIDKLRDSYLSKIDEVNKLIKETTYNSSLDYVKEKDITIEYANKASKLKEKLFETEQQIIFLTCELADSEDFLKELSDKENAILDSIAMGNALLDIKFTSCPCCFSQLKKITNACPLCGSEDTKNIKSNNLLRMKQEVQLQIKESKSIYSRREEELHELKIVKNTINSNLRRYINEKNSVISRFNTSLESKMYNYYKDIGELEEKIKSLNEIEELYNYVKTLSEKRQELQTRLNNLDDDVKCKLDNIEQRRSDVNKTITAHLIEILKNDIGSEEQFKNADIIDYDLASNKISVNKKISFSESSMVYLNNAFHVALFFTSLDHDFIRIPRLMILDGIENGGMEDSRSQNFQRIIQEKLSKYNIINQIIIATKSIYAPLKNNTYLVGSEYTASNKSLKI